MDLIVETFSQLPEKKLIVIGDGPDFKKVKSKAGKNIELLGYQRSEVLKDYLQRAKAFVFAAEEDFGLFTRRGPGLWDSGHCLWEGRGGGDGVFFSEQSVSSLMSAVEFPSTLLPPNNWRASRAGF